VENEKGDLEIVRKASRYFVKECDGRLWSPYAEETAKKIFYLLSRSKRELPRSFYSEIEMPMAKPVICPKCKGIAINFGRAASGMYILKCKRNGAFLVDAITARNTRRKYSKRIRKPL